MRGISILSTVPRLRWQRSTLNSACRIKRCMHMPKILISDVSLRDGSHAVRHQLTKHQLTAYASAAESAGIPIVEVGHGNGLGASSLQVGESLLSDVEMLTTVREQLKKSKLGIHVIPGF